MNGRIAQLRIDGRVVGASELASDAVTGATLKGTINTIYLGRYDGGIAASSYGSYVLHNPDQSTETYSSYGVLQNEADRFGNQVDYQWDSSGRITSISDHFIAGRAITFTYNSGGFVANDLGGRTVTYSLNSSNDLVSVTKTNIVPDPKSGITTTLFPSTGYAYATGHLLRQVTDPGGCKTTVNYDQSYRQVVLVDNPSAYWRLDETSGSVGVDSAGSYSVTYSAAVLGQGGALWNDLDTAVKFNGSAYAQRANGAGLNPATFTVEAWVKVTANPDVGYGIVSTAYRGAAGSRGPAISTMNKYMGKAEEALRSARILLEAQDHAGAANRAYYAALHAARAAVAHHAAGFSFGSGPSQVRLFVGRRTFSIS